MPASHPETGTKPRRIDSLDGIRAAAILGVVVLHLLLISGSPVATSSGAGGTITWGLLGNVIDVFFIVSGFLVFLPMVRRGELGDVRDYSVSRFARIFPGYWLCLVVLFVLTTWLATSPFVVSPGLGNIGIHVLGLQMPARMFDLGSLYDPTYSMGFGIDGALWMISIIIGFYVVLPFVARPYLRHPLAGLVIAAAITFGWKEAILHFGGFFETLSHGAAPDSNVPLIAVNQLPGWAFSFALGMSAAWAWQHVSIERIRGVLLNRWFVVAAVAVYAASSYRYGHIAAQTADAASGSVSRLHPLMALASSASRAALIAIVVVGPLWLRRPFEGRIPRELSELSYGLYLIHLVVALYAGYLFDLPMDGSAKAVFLWFVVVIPVSLAYSQLSLSLVERPILRRLRAGPANRASRPGAPPATSPTAP
jgi:peptidoglycan/LPS O-acetylase OafA/YrhL